MPAIHRLQWIDAQIRAGAFPNAKTLGEAFEISRRQALRDFEYLRDSLGAPLEYSALKRGYTYGKDSFTLPGPYVTEAQRATLGSLAAYYEEIAGRDVHAAPVYADLAGLFRRLHGGHAPRAALPPIQPKPLAPFHARLSGAPRAPALQPYWRGEQTYEFHDPEAFLAALLSSGHPQRIERPAWLRERLLSRLARFQTANADVTRHVTSPVVPSPQNDMRRASTVSQIRHEVSARWQPSWMSYIGAVQGVLEGAGMGRWAYWKLMGATGMAFHLVMHERCCISSVTVYDWMNTHVAALDRIGILSETYGAMPGSPTYDAACRRALSNIKAAIDRGVGVVLWGVDTGEFGVISGYDDEDGVLFSSGCMAGPGETNPILYANLGRTFPGAPILHYQIVLEQVPTDEAQTARSALNYYVDLMERPDHGSRGYQAGLLAYDNWVRGLQTEGFDQRGVRYATFVYAEAKECAAKYLEYLAETDPALAPAAAAMRRTAGIYSKMMGALGQTFTDPSALEKPVTADHAASLLPLLREAKAAEAETLVLVKRYLRQ